MKMTLPIYLLLFFLLLTNVLSLNVHSKTGLMYPFSCSQSDQIQTCAAFLYHISHGLSVKQIASFYSVNSSSIKPITNDLRQDYFVSVPCSCKDVNGTTGYFYDNYYKVKSGDALDNITSMIYSGQAWMVAGEVELIFPGQVMTIHLLCGCTEVQSQEKVTYTVQSNDTLSGIAEHMSAELSGTESLNKMLTQNPSFFDLGWVLFIPMEKNGRTPAPKQGKRHGLTLVLEMLSAATLVSVSMLLLFLLRRNRMHKSTELDEKAADKCPSPLRTSLRSHFRKKGIEDARFQTELPAVFGLEEVDIASSSFDESKKIREGRYGTVYLGFLKEQEVAIKKMKSSRSKEFAAELKLLCKIHHINLVELLGYASGDDHLYLVYAYVQNGSLNDHLDDPLLKGHSPLAWVAGAHIALDAARGIEYIHDHTRARYVHREIKTSNILLDQGLRAKVADFGLARLVERSKVEDIVATRLVGTPGYIAAESLRELQMTSKGDVFAFGVVLSELITGQRALIRDNRGPNKLKSLFSVMLTIFRDQNPETALEAIIDGNLRGSYPLEEVYKMAELARRCLSEDPVDRPEMREVVKVLSQIQTSSIEWEASLGGSSQVFTSVLDGR